MSIQEFTSESEAQTKQIAFELTQELLPKLDDEMPVLVLLEGDFGAGKTQFVKGLGRALGIEENKITSPSYTYMNEHKFDSEKGYKFKLIHVDAWRIKTLEDLKLTGFVEFLRAGNIVVVEWGGGLVRDQLKQLNISNLVVVEVKIAQLDENKREITIDFDENG